MFVQMRCKNFSYRKNLVYGVMELLWCVTTKLPAFFLFLLFFFYFFFTITDYTHTHQHDELGNKNL